MSPTAMDIVKLFEEDTRARKRLAELLIGEPDVRLPIINAVLRDIATKSDLEKLSEELREEFRREIGRLEDRVLRVEERLAKLEERVSRLEERITRVEEKVAGLDKRVDMMFKFMLMLNTPILVAVIGILLKMILTP